MRLAQASPALLLALLLAAMPPPLASLDTDALRSLSVSFSLSSHCRQRTTTPGNASLRSASWAAQAAAVWSARPYRSSCSERSAPSSQADSCRCRQLHVSGQRWSSVSRRAAHPRAGAGVPTWRVTSLSVRRWARSKDSVVACGKVYRRTWASSECVNITVSMLTIMGWVRCCTHYLRKVEDVYPT